MDSSTASEVHSTSSQWDSDKLKLFERIVYFASGSIGDKVSSVHTINQNVKE